MSKTTIINQEVLAQHLEAAARRYRDIAQDALAMPPGTRKQLVHQAQQADEWARVFRSAWALGWTNESDMEVSHH